MQAKPPVSEPDSRLCLACGLCCDGTLFADVELQAADSATRLKALGLPLKRGKNSEGEPVKKFTQPCAALGSDCRCALYAERPARCREFDCDLLRAVRTGERTVEAALRKIREARWQRDSVRASLASLGDQDLAKPLSKRFQRVKAALESGRIPEGLEWEEATERFGDLTLAVSALQFTLREVFYSGRKEGK